jgi:hypothetical protein
VKDSGALTFGSVEQVMFFRKRMESENRYAPAGGQAEKLTTYPMRRCTMGKGRKRISPAGSGQHGDFSPSSNYRISREIRFSSDPGY